MDLPPGTSVSCWSSSGAQAVPATTRLATVLFASWPHLGPCGQRPQRGLCCCGVAASCALRIPLFCGREPCVVDMLSSVYMLAPGQMAESRLHQHEQSKEMLGLQTRTGWGRAVSVALTSWIRPLSPSLASTLLGGFLGLSHPSYSLGDRVTVSHWSGWYHLPHTPKTGNSGADTYKENEGSSWAEADTECPLNALGTRGQPVGLGAPCQEFGPLWRTPSRQTGEAFMG